MFKLLAQVPPFWIDVEIAVPAGDQPPVLPLLVEYRPASELDKLVQEGGLGAFLRAVARDWRDVEVPFSPEALNQLIDQYPASPAAVWNAYTKAIRDAKRKN